MSSPRSQPLLVEQEPKLSDTKQISTNQPRSDQNAKYAQNAQNSQNYAYAFGQQPQPQQIQQYPQPQYPQQQYQPPQLQGYPPQLAHLQTPYIPPPPISFPPLTHPFLIPSHITPSHQQYQHILHQIHYPCVVCRGQGIDSLTMVSGCAAYSWATCLFCFTGFLGCWVPFLINDCKDVKISCGRCGHVKAVVYRNCCE